MPARNKSAPLSRPLPPFGKYYSANNDLPGARPSVREKQNLSKLKLIYYSDISRQGLFDSNFHYFKFRLLQQLILRKHDFIDHNI